MDTNLLNLLCVAGELEVVPEDPRPGGGGLRVALLLVPLDLFEELGLLQENLCEVSISLLNPPPLSKLDFLHLDHVVRQPLDALERPVLVHPHLGERLEVGRRADVHGRRHWRRRRDPPHRLHHGAHAEPESNQKVLIIKSDPINRMT